MNLKHYATQRDTPQSTLRAFISILILLIYLIPILRCLRIFPYLTYVSLRDPRIIVLASVIIYYVYKLKSSEFELFFFKWEKLNRSKYWLSPLTTFHIFLAVGGYHLEKRMPSEEAIHELFQILVFS